MGKVSFVFFGFCLFLATSAWAQPHVIHIQSPWTSDSDIVNENHYLLGDFCSPTENDSCRMTSEGDGWFSFTINASFDSIGSHWMLSLETESTSWNLHPFVDSLFAGGTTEIWVFTTEISYEVSLSPPSSSSSEITSSSSAFVDDSKRIYFKSPWGSRLVPQMIWGGDTLAMQVATGDTSLCGWFFVTLKKASVSLAMPVYFKSSATNQTFPIEGTVDVAPVLTQNSQVFVDGMDASSEVNSAQLGIGVCFDSTHIIRFRNPWSNTIPSMIVGKDTVHMEAIPGYCGWYQTKYTSTTVMNKVSFKQTIGREIYTASGLVAGAPIVLDSLMSISDSIWIKPYPYPSGLPVLSTAFPGGLAECSRNLAVMVFDWLGELEKDNVTDPDFGIGSDECGGGSVAMTGMVQNSLGANGLPVRNDASFPSECTAANDLNGWFIADTIKKGYTNATCRDIEMTLDDEGFWVADMDEDEAAGKVGFFPIDDFQYLDSDSTIENPKWDSVAGKDWQGKHNYSFSMKVQAEFRYVKGQYFEFRGDDDVWVFIDERLVVDLGGKHAALEGSVNLDTIGRTTGDTLVEGRTYSFHIFYAERSRPGSNFMMRTTMDLQTERTYYPQKMNTAANLIQYEIWQIVKGKSLTCDYSKILTTETTLAASDFMLTGGALSEKGVTLTEGLNYGGITIDSGYTGFTVDTAAIILNRSLAPGIYCLHFSLASDPSLYDEIYFTIPEYPLPTIAFADSSWIEIPGDVVTTTLGEWAATPYPVNVGIFYMGATCSICNEELQLSTPDSLIFLDSLQHEITSIVLENGRATFWVMSRHGVENASFTVSGMTISNMLSWQNITLREPPVPTLETAGMYDRNGDGVADSLYLNYSRSLSGKDSPDSLFWQFGDSLVHSENRNALNSAKMGKSSLSFTSNAFTKAVFTGMQENPYSGDVTTWFTYVPTEGADSGKSVPFEVTGRIQDKVGPILLSASVVLRKNDVVALTLSFSESLEANEIPFDSLFEYHFWRSGKQMDGVFHSISGGRYDEHYRYEILYSARVGEVPSVGDSVRFVPGVGRDLSGNSPHLYNPWVRIVGEQKVIVESTTLTTLTPSNTSDPASPSVSPLRVELDKNIEDVALEVGLPGHLIEYNMAELLLNLNADRDSSLGLLTADSVKLLYEVYYFTNLGQYVNSAQGTIACSDSLFGGDCLQNPGNIFLAWNARSTEGRLVGSGAYIAQLNIRMKAGDTIVSKTETDSVWGVRRTGL